MDDVRRRLLNLLRGAFKLWLGRALCVAGEYEENWWTEKAGLIKHNFAAKPNVN